MSIFTTDLLLGTYLIGDVFLLVNCFFGRMGAISEQVELTDEEVVEMVEGEEHRFGVPGIEPLLALDICFAESTSDGGGLSVPPIVSVSATFV